MRGEARPSFLIFRCSVVRCMPSSRAAFSRYHLHSQMVVLIQVHGGVKDRCTIITGAEHPVGHQHLKVDLA